MIRTTSLALLAFLALLPGCSSDSDGSVGGPAQPFPYIRLAPTPPPPPEAEMPPVNYEPQTRIWRPGYWRYDGIDFEWVSGEFIARPYPTAVWSSDRWDKHAFGWAFVPGRWQ